MWLSFPFYWGELQKRHVIFGCDNKQHHLPDSSHIFFSPYRELANTNARKTSEA